MNISLYCARLRASIGRPYEIASLNASGLHSHTELNINTSAASKNLSTSLRSPHMLTLLGKSAINGSQ